MYEYDYRIIRELLKEALDCDYKSGDIKMLFTFYRKRENEIVFSYNDLSEGGKVVTDLTDEQYDEIKDNLLTITEKKGNYLNIAELCFAFAEKKMLNKDSKKEFLRRTLNIAVAVDGEITVSYKVAYFKKAGNKFIRFSQDGKTLADFICHEQDGFIYVVPFAVAASKRQNIARVFMVKYGFFSTYELNPEEIPRKIKYEKQSAFFISIPYKYIQANDGDGIIEMVEQGVKNLVETYSQCFILDVYELPDEKNDERIRYGFRPRSYAFGFVRGFVVSSKLMARAADCFLENISVQFPEEDSPVSYSELRETAFSQFIKGVTEGEHRTGKAYRKNILARREEMFKQLSGHSEKTMYLSYEWENGREFYYEFVRPKGEYIVESRVKPGLSDYGLHGKFNSFAEKQLFKYFSKGSFVEDEDALEAVFASFDEAFDNDYKINMRYYQLYVSRGEERDVVNISKVNVVNLKKAIDTLFARRDRFTSSRAFDETVKMLVNIFTDGKDVTSCFIQLKEQGVPIKLVSDSNGKTRFSVYGNLFLIPPRMSASEMLQIIGDIRIILDSKMWTGREFDFPVMKTRYFFNADAVSDALESEFVVVDHNDVVNVLDKFLVSDLKMDKVAFLNKNNKIMEILDVDEHIPDSVFENYTQKDVKIVFLKEGCLKPETADVLEWLIMRENRGYISGSYTKNIRPNIVLPDQIPYYNRPTPEIKHAEFEYLRSEIRRLDGVRGKREIVKQAAYRNYFAKDVNYKLFGYGGCCPICGTEFEMINGFVIRDFTIELISALDGMENAFKIALYMCANDFYTADGWVIEDIVIGGMNPFMWLNEVAAAKVIAPEFLRCSLLMTTRVTGEIPASDMVKVKPPPRRDRLFRRSADLEKARKDFETPRTTVEFTLSPLLAAKWVEDNVSE
ncbi:MAG: hypothetical protein FWG83_02595 [Oscillospiraceae bacterium]|nr:hypothetical protein [Oscillospiraceae bacterium]